MPSVSSDQIKKIVHRFITNAPPGELLEVVSDVRVLLNNDKVFNTIAPLSFAEYNKNQYIIIDSPSGNKVLITPYGEIRSGEYLDPVGNCVITFNHIKQEATGSRPIGNELPSEAEPYRKAFEAEALKYTEAHYQHGAQTTYSKVKGSKYIITTCISSAIINQKNFWGGRWRSTWTFTFNPGSGSCEMEGLFKIQVHYYEEGNVQLNTDTKKSKSVPVAEPNELAAAVFRAVENIETDFQSALEESYHTMGSTTFKALRRNLPITQSKIDWDKIIQYKTGQAILH
ncbi:F-actin-capping protein subunit alpha-like [Schistocerca gregaria]|uniref:F-actin-capping protein subunit alpha-like n=1 Tax=Schistocerca gregaria TaxID=7010 RepID=UPI00211F3583|nr:F-actin-capping protein subunit alpha-like [Schistocerca gregaria]